MITLFTILGTRHYLLDYPNLHNTYNELMTSKTNNKVVVSDNTILINIVPKNILQFLGF